MNIGFIGTGKIAYSVITGIFKSKIIYEKIVISPRNKEIANMIAQVEKGSEIIGAGGILGKVTDVKDLYVSIEISSGTVIKLQKTAIANILPKGTIDSI